jgi:hypothetical protein
VSARDRYVTRISIEPMYKATVVDEQLSRLFAVATAKMNDDSALETL